MEERYNTFYMGRKKGRDKIQNINRLERKWWIVITRPTAVL